MIKIKAYVNRISCCNPVVLLRGAVTEFFADHLDHLAASVSFNLFFSLFPMAFAAVYVTGSIQQLQNLQSQILSGIDYMLPGFGQMILGVTSNTDSIKSGVGVLILLGAIWGGISFFNAVTLSLNVAWGVNKPPSLFKTQLINFVLLIGAGVFVFLSILLTIMFDSGADASMQNQVNEFLGTNVGMLVLANILVMVFAFTLFLLFYRYVTSTRPAWKDIWQGALIAAIFFEATKYIFIFYLRVFNPYNFIDRSVSTAIGFMMWTYSAVLIFLLVAKVTNFTLRKRVVKEIDN